VLSSKPKVRLNRKISLSHNPKEAFVIDRKLFNKTQVDLYSMIIPSGVPSACTEEFPWKYFRAGQES